MKKTLLVLFLVYSLNTCSQVNEKEEILIQIMQPFHTRLSEREICFNNIINNNHWKGIVDLRNELVINKTKKELLYHISNGKKIYNNHYNCVIEKKTFYSEKEKELQLWLKRDETFYIVIEYIYFNNKKINVIYDANGTDYFIIF